MLLTEYIDERIKFFRECGPDHIDELVISELEAVKVRIESQLVTLTEEQIAQFIPRKAD